MAIIAKGPGGRPVQRDEVKAALAFELLAVHAEAERRLTRARRSLVQGALDAHLSWGEIGDGLGTGAERERRNHGRHGHKGDHVTSGDRSTSDRSVA